jgi:putative oxidoreductase
MMPYMLLKRLALLLYSSQLLLGGWQQANEPTVRAERARALSWPVSDEFVRLSGWAMIAGALALQIKPLRRLAALLLALQLLPITYVGHRYWEAEGPAQTQQMIHFFKNISMVGGALYIAFAED